MMSNPAIMFDVGANDGASSIRWANQGGTVYAFEPTPELAADLRARTAHLGNYHVIEAAVSDYDGRSEFHVCPWEDWGCSSLRKRTAYSDVAFRNCWPEREEFPVITLDQVQVTRLDTFISDRDLGRIDFLHIDAQGEDFRVLRGLGDKIGIVRAGVVEVAADHNVTLYEGQGTVGDVREYLNANGFDITAQKANGGNWNELNVYFARRVGV